MPANGSVTINDIPVGTYTVSEEANGTAVKDYGLAVSGEGNVTVTKDATATPAVVPRSGSPRPTIKLNIIYIHAP